jgi:hypothetical protein
MLMDFAKTKRGQKEAEEIIRSFPVYGTKGITPDNFLDHSSGKHFTYYTYTLDKNLSGRKNRYHGFFDDKQEEDLHKILNYFPGEILTIN